MAESGKVAFTRCPECDAPARLEAEVIVIPTKIGKGSGKGAQRGDVLSG